MRFGGVISSSAQKRLKQPKVVEQHKPGKQSGVSAGEFGIILRVPKVASRLGEIRRKLLHVPARVDQLYQDSPVKQHEPRLNILGQQVLSNHVLTDR